MRNGFFALRSYSVALLTLAAGAVLSLQLADWQWFARSGALVVVNGIILTSRQIIEHMRSLHESQRSGCGHSARDWASGERSAILHDDNERRWLSEKCGLYLLIFGTLVWAFGDLAGLLADS